MDNLHENVKKSLDELKPRVKENIEFITKCLNEEISPDDLLSVQHKLQECINVCGLAAETKAKAKELLHLKRFLAADEHKLGTKLPASVLKDIIDGLSAEEIGLFVQADRLNAFLSHSIDGLRSMLSMIKTQIEKGI